MNAARTETSTREAGIAERPGTDDVELALLVGAIHLVFVAVEEFVVPVPILRVPLGLALVLFVPGYFVTATLLPRRSDLTPVERIGLSIVLSIATIAVLVVVLDALPVGLHPRPLLIGVYAVSAAFGVAAILRRWRLPPGMAIGRIAWRPSAWWEGLGGRDRGAYSVLFAAVPALFAVGIAVFLAPSPDRTMTELYVLGGQDLIGGFPYTATAAGDVQLTVGVANNETGPRRYRIEAWELAAGSRAVRVFASAAFELDPGQVDEAPVAWRHTTPGDRRRVDLRLFVDDDTTPYRELTLWIDVPDEVGTAETLSPGTPAPSSTAS